MILPQASPFVAQLDSIALEMAFVKIPDTVTLFGFCVDHALTKPGNHRNAPVSAKQTGLRETKRSITAVISGIVATMPTAVTILRVAF